MNGLNVIVSPCGSGKNRAVNSWIRYHAPAVIVAPRHDLCEQHARNIRDPVKVQVRKSVLAFCDEAGEPLCAQYETAHPIQVAGGNVSALVCRACPSRHGCAALKAAREDSDAQIVCTVPQLAASTREGLAKRLGVATRDVILICDEGVDLFEQALLSPKELADSLAFLETDRNAPDVEREFWDSFAYRELVRVLLACKGGAVHPDVAAKSCGTTLARIAGQHKPLGRAQDLRCASGIGTHPAPLAERPDAARRLAPTLRVVTKLDALLGAISRMGVRAIEWQQGSLNVRVFTDVAESLYQHGGVVLDATPNELEISVLDPAPKYLRLDVPDGAPVKRTVCIRSHASFKSLTPKRGDDVERVVNWDLVERYVRDALRDATEDGVRRLLLVTFKLVADGINAGSGPVPAILEEWKQAAPGRAFDVKHFEVLTGMNTWAGDGDPAEWWDGCITIGDPRPNLLAAGANLRFVHGMLGRPEPTSAEISEAMYQEAARALAQAHGRLRAPCRVTPAWHRHYGEVVPVDWTDRNATIEIATGRPARAASMSGTDACPVAVAVALAGGAGAVARLTGADRKTVQRYASGERVPPAEWVAVVDAEVARRFRAVSID